MSQTATDLVIACIVIGVLNVVAANDGSVAVLIVGFVSGEIDLSKELLLMILELPNHFDTVPSLGMEQAAFSLRADEVGVGPGGKNCGALS